METREHGNIVILFSAICLESLINDYGIINTSSTFFKNYLDKLDTVSKWVIIPEFVTGKPFDTNGQAFQYLKELFTLRNKMVHPKTKTIDSDEEQETIIFEELVDCYRTVPKSIETIKKVTETLRHLDPNFDHLEDYDNFWNNNDIIKNETGIQKFIHSIIN